MMKRTRSPVAETPAAAFRDTARCEEVVGTLSLLANTKRLRILCTLLDADRSVAEILGAVGGTFSGVSQQLKLLTLAGHLSRRRSEKSIIYHLKDARVARILAFLKDEFPAAEA
jgi:ArsR family transcriptional regulator, virulence genes transcriptional regulator